MLKVTRHDAGDAAFPFIEFYDEHGLIEGKSTPPCVPAGSARVSP
jgi:hypothetical protein